ncbi:MAG: NAD(P)-binding protein [Candidatus Nitrohelix vancouverensis]|uniref:NAD(P)-binding protein n=1 Tax=Candidatus Nitrohelix vancouverensis TaxID=2705534 RepID=A0A7T0G3C8_9BACT|nr:MAG: NAD(P)-binding protein [Candidatus Nitrohelix vancouverensis]
MFFPYTSIDSIRALSKKIEDSTDIILGAGPTGLSVGLGVALRSASHNALILEAKSRPGGLAGSFYWKNHIVDYGPHRLSTILDNVRVLAEDLLGPDCLLKMSLHGVQYSGRLFQFPPRVIDWLSPECVYHLVSFGLSYIWGHLVWITRRFDTATFESIMIRKFGNQFYNKIIYPMAKKVWIEPRDIDPSFVTQRFASIHPFEVIKKILIPKQELNPAAFYYPRKGFEQLWLNIAHRFEQEGNHIAYNTKATRVVVQDNKIVRVEFSGPDGDQAIEGDNLNVVSTIPVTGLIQILEGFEPIDRLKELASRLRFKSMLLVAFEFDQPETLPFRTHIYPEDDFIFNRLFEQNQYSRETVEEGKSVVVADITVLQGDPLFEKSDQEIIDRVKKDMAKLRYIKSWKITDAYVGRVEYAYVVPDLETRKSFHEITHILKSIPNLILSGRFGIGEYDNSDYAMDQGLAIGAMLCGESSKLDYLLTLHKTRGRPIVG